eukprot:520870_1
MLLFAVISICILFIIALLHYQQHFQLICCTFKSLILKSRPSLYKTDSHITRTQMDILKSQNICSHICCCHLLKLDDDFDFFPSSFLFYILFKIILCILIIQVEILNYYDNTQETITDLLFGYSMKAYTQNSIYQLHKIQLISEEHIIHILIFILDHLLIYGIMISAVWESLFSFYRYYSTKYSINNYTLVSIKKLIFKFL